ncbi:SEC-C domain-containing protein [Thermoflavimicrobium dichotomicum]|uniref:SEC-C motif-containing protein n=1 Tax=Thermoflavimicrobium dichotomicum TaxID=46223 RepID=A0A1I3NC02_9BACL|nr:SEC-C domain-containing protein [Thermoflavimicrobium dichotomicum]SFJ06779.1 SEC-C motif-containing protein [Thermoflavimicrobium dichotomicum]
MLSRNKPCPCGSGRVYKSCCERVVTIQIAEKIREHKEKVWKNECLMDLNKWFKGYWKSEEQKWIQHFKELLQLPPDQSIPQNFSSSFQSWLLFDAPCISKRRPVEFWVMAKRDELRGKERVVRSLLEAKFTCYEVVEVGNESMVFRSLADQVEYEVIKEHAISKGKLIFTRLIRVGNRYEICGPFISFMHEMRGEILVQLEKYNRLDEEHQDLSTREHGWKVLGWSIQRAKELEKIEKMVSASPEMFENMREALLWPTVEQKSEHPGLPIKIIQQLEQFYVTQVTPLQKITQTFYSRSLEMLYQYLSLRFGQSFDWSSLNEDYLSHYFGVWYLEHAKSTPMGSKIFLNTSKHLFRWLYSQGISDIYLTFKKVYISLIRALPITIEARRWIMENGLHPAREEYGNSTTTDMFMLAVSSTGPVLLVKNKWKPIHLRGFPTIWSDYRFWVRGTVQFDKNACYFIHVDNLYPMVTILDTSVNENQVLGHK